MPVNMFAADFPPRPRLTYLFRQLQLSYAQGLDTVLSRAGFSDIKPGAAKVFPFVPAEGIQVSELATRCGVRKQTMTQAVDQLVRAGYAERRTNPHDGRAQLIFLTERGKAARPLAVEAGDRIEASWAELTSSEEIEALRGQLTRLVARIEADPASQPASSRVEPS